MVRVPAGGATLRLGAAGSPGCAAISPCAAASTCRRCSGSRATDLLSGIGPEPLASRHAAAGGPDTGIPAARRPRRRSRAPEGGTSSCGWCRGPRADWFVDDALEALLGAPYEVTGESNRVGMRLDGPALERSRDDELPSEGMVCGALQVPPSGQPTLFLTDHPVTGGYPVIAVVVSADLPLAAQARPGQRLLFRAARSAAPPATRQAAPADRTADVPADAGADAQTSRRSHRPRPGPGSAPGWRPRPPAGAPAGPRRT